ncbi:membrane protease YdiL (CAAX protease family) [Salirhabdus euzebyi]|uniref:Membrane protease YdiL (CAAX protease family) n=1 Tax=Salirhabdus euzebyi TaxID=394506 RepID=A0A841Q5Z8_9BACI|nr:CPBP family intramembrane glutamic endopeptidase [Salirhabdus euzebyi]MBB6453828.1 membrane protease YdiL (CAAX protease family) [Salirhabdus euzebyi]
MTKKHMWTIISLTIISCLLMLIIEQGLQTTYFTKTIAKIILFLAVPLFYIRFILKEKILVFLNLKNIDITRLKTGFLFGILSFLIILVAYYVLKDFINAETIISDLKNRLHITPEIYIFIALYITFGNSLLEEFYFRGFIFLKIYQTNHKKLAYVFSAALFAIYHVAIFINWFNIWLIMLALIGLFTVGLIFNWLNTKSNNFLNSWILHILADIAIVAIGFYLYQIT